MWFFFALLLKREEESGISVYLLKESMFMPDLERNGKQPMALVKDFFSTSAKVIKCINPGEYRP